MAAAKLGIFEALADGSSSSASIAERCETDPFATEKLLFALAAAGYADFDGRGYSLTAMSRKWLLQDSETSLVDKQLF